MDSGNVFLLQIKQMFDTWIEIVDCKDGELMITIKSTLSLFLRLSEILIKLPGGWPLRKYRLQTGFDYRKTFSQELTSSNCWIVFNSHWQSRIEEYVHWEYIDQWGQREKSCLLSPLSLYICMMTRVDCWVSDQNPRARGTSWSGSYLYLGLFPSSRQEIWRRNIQQCTEIRNCWSNQTAAPSSTKADWLTGVCFSLFQVIL